MTGRVPWFEELAGESHEMAEVLARGAFPPIRGTSSAFMRGTHAQDSGYDRMRYAAAAAAGVDTNGRRYLSGLARYPNDPEAWVSDLSDVGRVVRERGWNCEGALDVTSFPQGVVADLVPDYDVAPDILEGRVEAELEPYDPPDRTDRRAADARERLIAELTGRVDLSPEPKVSAYEDPFEFPGMEPED
jgi:hypothetical protein